MINEGVPLTEKKMDKNTLYYLDLNKPEAKQNVGYIYGK